MTSFDQVRMICPECQVMIGENHERGCDVRRCLWTGMQHLGCPAAGLITEYANGLPVVPDIEPGHDCGVDVWSGWWPGYLEAAALGLWCRWGPQWVPCGADHPDARPDLNRLVTECEWDRVRGQWLRRVGGRT
jgi:hypothetical protein